ncbi:MAG: hypothetical protein GY855_07125 [candidate division Zixibacteria bacterium]|nr:hypothetical protein [candidate division Zixibacteria bacterium]
MRLISSDDIKKVCSTNYEAVLIASQYARKLNSARIANEQVETMEDNEANEKPALKVTSQALYDLIDNKIKFSKR